ncbi:flavodoxin [Chitinophaga sp. ARDCPP14]|uniref:flavodoxin n=1 Tax=Chitinophaga sp. ARDCPP14 TaxID=3391139 RepID=UPI003F525105
MPHCYGAGANAPFWIQASQALLNSSWLTGGNVLPSPGFHPASTRPSLKSYHLKGKQVIPFNTNGGDGIGSSFDKVKELCPDSKVPEGLTMTSGSERDGKLLLLQAIKQWKLKLKW